MTKSNLGFGEVPEISRARAVLAELGVDVSAEIWGLMHYLPPRQREAVAHRLNGTTRYRTAKLMGISRQRITQLLDSAGKHMRKAAENGGAK